MKTNGFSLPVRIIHMIGFEVIAVIIFAPIAAFVLNKGIMEVGALGLIISLTAMLWNFVYNYLFDTVETSLKMDRFNRSILTRIVHALFFELGLLIATIPLIAYWLDMTLLQAFIVDIAFVVFFLIYAFVYNWAFDTIYLKLYRSDIANVNA
ncbi:PACE efflux transporter [Fangia hongkongensis]|uniref:PACE efflux transporter n=1 Tax=Fangia hongkongensis TaxID=270495 RepID=UPI00036631D8|nr:PACE efflux transporter [Fangia hongkongensis]